MRVFFLVQRAGTAAGEVSGWATASASVGKVATERMAYRETACGRVDCLSLAMEQAEMTVPGSLAPADALPRRTASRLVA